jgi:hypothetical protein
MRSFLQNRWDAEALMRHHGIRESGRRAMLGRARVQRMSGLF